MSKFKITWSIKPNICFYCEHSYYAGFNHYTCRFMEEAFRSTKEGCEELVPACMGLLRKEWP